MSLFEKKWFYPCRHGCGKILKSAVGRRKHELRYHEKPMIDKEETPLDQDDGSYQR